MRAAERFGSLRERERPLRSCRRIHPVGAPSVALGSKGLSVPITEAFTDAADTVAHLAECVLEGRKAPVATATERLLETYDGLAIINDIFVPILDVVGQKYDEGTFFLPQLMVSAEAVKAGFDLIPRPRSGSRRKCRRSHPRRGRPWSPLGLECSHPSQGRRKPRPYGG